MARSGFISKDVPSPAGPYSHAAKIGNIVAIAGQAGIEPATGEIVSDDIKEQTKLTFDNLANALAAAGASLDDVIQTRVFLADGDDFEAMNAVYGTYFTAPYPARTTVGVDLLMGLKVEIDVIAVLESEQE